MHMLMTRKWNCVVAALILMVSCGEKDPGITPDALQFLKAEIDGQQPGPVHYDTKVNPTIKLFFNNAVDRQTVAANIVLQENVVATGIPVNYSYEKNDSVVIISPQIPLKYLTRYFIRAT